MSTNAQNFSYRLKVNEYADSTTCEFVSKCTGKNSNNMLSGLRHLRNHECVGQPPANTVDWTAMGAATPVKNREQCDLRKRRD